MKEKYKYLYLVIIYKKYNYKSINMFMSIPKNNMIIINSIHHVFIILYYKLVINITS